MLTSGQIRAGRAFLGWSARELAKRAGVHLNTVQRIERRDSPLRANAESLRRIESTFGGAGIAFETTDGCLVVSFKGPPGDGAG